MKISYAIPVCNEIEEIKRLLSFLIENKREKDEIVIFYDEINGTAEVREYLKSIVSGHTYTPIEDYPIRWYSYDFDGDFAKMKNKLNKMCTGDYIFQIDADEMVTEFFIDVLPQMIQLNPQVDLYRIARVNKVTGLTPEHIQKWGWVVDSRGRVNWPDVQWRIYRNNPNIKWEGKVHEKITGYNTHSILPLEEEWALQHTKTIERQEKQNDYYNTL